MKKNILLILMSTLTLLSCSSDNNDTPAVNAQYAMTAKINGVTFQANNPFGTNKFSNTNIFNYFLIQDYVMLQGRPGGVLGNPEINIWLKRSDIVVGTYIIGSETFNTPISHFIDLTDNSNGISETTKEGVITITEVDTSGKIVVGTFRFTTVEDPNIPSAPIDFDVTEGTFRYVYE